MSLGGQEFGRRGFTPGAVSLQHEGKMILYSRHRLYPFSESPVLLVSYSEADFSCVS